MSRSVLVVVDDDPVVTEALAAGLYADSRTIVVCNTVEAAELIVEEALPEAVISDIQLAGRFDFDGLRLLTHIATHSPDTAVVLMSGARADGLADEATRRGALAFLQKPFGLDEIEEVLLKKIRHLHRANGRFSSDAPVIRIPSLDEMLEGQLLFARFQAIVDLREPDERRYGFESLIRADISTPLANPVALFRYAQRCGRLFDLDMACIDRGMRDSKPLAGKGLLFINVHPLSFDRPEILEQTILSAQERYGLSPGQIVLEITEQVQISLRDSTFACCKRLRNAGFRFALDDVGAGFSHLEHVAGISPSYLKISQQLGTGFESDATRMKVVRNVVALAKELDCEVILEGVETAATAEAARDIGISLAQGYYYSRPAEASSF